MRRPLFIAEQARNPHGLVGRVVAAIMKRETDAPNRRVVAALEVGSGDHVLDIGCGNGISLGLLAEAAPQCQVVGIDPSMLMVKRATAHNRALIEAGRIKVALADVGALPFADGSFDKVMSVHTLYFLEDLSAAFREIARVLKSGGKCVLFFRTSANDKTSDFSDKVYRFRSRTEIIGTLEAAGFDIMRGKNETDEPALVVVMKGLNGS